MALRVAAFDGQKWTAPTTVSSGDRLFASWADVPAVAADASGRLYAVWPERSGTGEEDYGLEVARADSFGAAWRRLGALHEPGAGEHGFVSLLPEAGGDAIVAWVASHEREGRLRVRRVSSDGKLGAPRTVAPIRLAPSSGFPRIARIGDRLLVCWVDADEPFHLRAATLPLADVPGPASGNR
jgi:hypothetical protein